jgi:hypothetical protein
MHVVKNGERPEPWFWVVTIQWAPYRGGVSLKTTHGVAEFPPGTPASARYESVMEEALKEAGAAGAVTVFYQCEREEN